MKYEIHIENEKAVLFFKEFSIDREINIGDTITLDDHERVTVKSIEINAIKETVVLNWNNERLLTQGMEEKLLLELGFRCCDELNLDEVTVNDHYAIMDAASSYLRMSINDVGEICLEHKDFIEIDGLMQKKTKISSLIKSHIELLHRMKEDGREDSKNALQTILREIEVARRLLISAIAT